MIIDECKYMRDSHFVNSTELKEKYTYIHTTACWGLVGLKEGDNI